MQTEFQKQKNETQPSHVFVESPGLMQTVLMFWVFFFFILHRKAVQMFPRAGLRFPCFLFATLFLALLRCQDAPLLGSCVFLFFLRVGLQQEGHLQASSKWEIVGRLPWRPLKSALLKRLLCCCCRRLLWGMPDLLRGEECEGGLEERRGGHWRGHISFDLFQKVFLITLLRSLSCSLSLSAMFQFCAAQNRTWTVPKSNLTGFFHPAESCVTQSSSAPTHSPSPACLFWLLVCVS